MEAPNTHANSHKGCERPNPHKPTSRGPAKALHHSLQRACTCGPPSAFMHNGPRRSTHASPFNCK
uniref:Uncharacterized protein n=1 Tax=Manihot esculenta TaxID=3983 RepID=A0A2C9U2X0_MANES